MCRPGPYSFSFYRGDDFSLVFTVNGDRTAGSWTLTLKPTLETASPTLTVTAPALTAVYVPANDWTLVTIPLTAAQTQALTNASYFHDVAYNLAGVKTTFIAGRVDVTKDVGTA
jgi:hypothetical protein